jgi:2'-5' RNA ligase
MIWAGVEPHDPIAALHRKVDQCLARVGVTPETRAFTPHVTLARLGRGSGPVAAFLAHGSDLASPAFEFGHVTLYESELGHGGSRYHPVARYPLDGENSATSAAATASTSSHVAAKPSSAP